MIADKMQPDKKHHYLPVLEAAIIGFTAGASALILNHGVRWLGSLRVDIANNSEHLWLLPLFGAMGGLLAGLLVAAAPEAAGSGIPQVRALLDRLKMTLGLKTAVIKLIAGTIALGSGLFMGREGPTVQVGAAIAAHLSSKLKTTREHRRQLIAAGAGAGLAAAFSAPVAGVVFVLEELLKEIKPATIALALVACACASLLQHLTGSSPTTGIGGTITQVRVHWQDVPFFILLGLLCGALGALFNACVLFFLKTFRAIKLPMPLKVALAGLITGLVVTILPADLHDYAHARAMMDANLLPPPMVPLAFICFFLLTLIAYGSGAPGGLFAPALALGSAVGYMVGAGEQWLLGNTSIDMFSLVGMGAFFSGAMRVPLTAIVIVFEMASDFAIVTPLMISCTIASTVGDLLYKGGLYDLLMVWSGINLHNPEWQATTTATVMPAAKLAAAAIMQEKVQTINSELTCKQATALLPDNELNGFPVVASGQLIGIATAADIIKQEPDTLIKEIMITNPVSVSPFDELEELVYLFSAYHFTWLAVTENDDFLGVIRQSDLIHAAFDTSAIDANGENAAS